MEVLLLVIDISAMFLLVRWSAKSEPRSPHAGNQNAFNRRPPTRPQSKSK